METSRINLTVTVYSTKNINGFKIIFFVEHNNYNITTAYPQLKGLRLVFFRSLIVFFNDFSTYLKRSNVTVCADDTVIYVTAKDTSIIEIHLSSDVKSVADWWTKK